MKAAEQGCRAGRRPPSGVLASRLAVNERERREHRSRLQREIAAKAA